MVHCVQGVVQREISRDREVPRLEIIDSEHGNHYINYGAIISGKKYSNIRVCFLLICQTIKATGVFIEKSKGQASWVAFITRDGHAYNMQRGTFNQGARDMPQGLPPPTVYVEGFLVQEGDGYFWPLLITMPDARFLTTPKQSIELLNLSRERNIELLVGELALCTF